MTKAMTTDISPEGINDAFFRGESNRYVHPSMPLRDESVFADYYGNRIDVPVPSQDSNKAIRGFSDDPNYQFPADESGRAIQTEDITQMTGYIPKEAPKPADVPIETIALLSPAEAEKVILKQAGERPTIQSAMESLWPAFQKHAIEYLVSQGHYPDARELGEMRKQFDKDKQAHEKAKEAITNWDNNVAQQKKLVEETRTRKTIDAKQFKESTTEADKKINLLPTEERQAHKLSFQKKLYESMKDPDPVSRQQKIDFAIMELPETSKTEDKERILPAEQVNKIGEFSTYIDTMNQIQGMINSGKVDTGPFEFIKKRLDNWGVAPKKDRIELRTIVARLPGLMYAMRGKQLSDKELQVALEMMPKMSSDETVFAIETKNFNDYMIKILKGKEKAFQEAGYSSGSNKKPPLDSYFIGR
jgi:hypothetical protein